MKVTISALGRFHAFYLAHELARHGALHQLLTSYPAGRAVAYGVPRERIVARPHLEVLNRSAQRLANHGLADPRAWACQQFDRFAARQLSPEADVFVGWSGCSLRALERARELGMLTVVERGSTHILHQQEVLRREYDRVGIRGRLPHPRTIEQELLEYELADRIAVPTRFVAETFVARGIEPSRLLQSPYGVSLESFSPPEQRPERFRIIHCGNVSVRKGCHVLLQAFHELALPDAELWFVGPVAEDAQPFIERYRGPAVHFKGRVPQSELIGYYGESTVFCLASLEEGMAMVVPQAMACGLPIIATEESGAMEAVRTGVEGTCIPARDVEALKAALRDAFEHRERWAEMGRRASERVSSGFSWSDYGDRVFAGYQNALAGARTTTSTSRAA